MTNAWTRYISDPGGYNLGFARAHWIPALSRLLLWGGDSHNYKGNNSLRLFDPAANTVETIWPNDWQNGGLQNRDNYLSFFVPSRGQAGEFWVIDGTYTTCDPPGVPGTHYAGRFDLATRQWQVFTDGPSFGAGLIKNWKWQYGDSPGSCSLAAADWSTQLNTGVVYGGTVEGNPLNTLWLIEPNLAGPEPFVLNQFAGPVAVGDVHQRGVCAGEYFYLFTGGALWRLHIPSRAWVQLAPPINYGDSFQCSLTYDSLNSALIAHGGIGNDKVFVYLIGTDSWEDVSATMQRAGAQPVPRFNHVAVYAPSVNRHLITGGSSDENHPWYDFTKQIIGYQYADGGGPPPPPPPPDNLPPSKPTGLTATVGTTLHVALAWTPGTDNVGVVGFKVYRNGILLTPMPIAAPAFNDDLTVPGTYNYTVTDLDAAGNESPQSDPFVVSF